MRESVREGHALGLFVEGTRQLNGVPGRSSPAPRWSRSRRTFRSSLPRSTARTTGSPATAHPISVAWGEPLRFDGLPKNGKGYREASAEVQTRIHGLHDWLGEMHALGRPKHATPPA